MGFLHPELLLMALPAAWWLWRTRTQSRGVWILRALVLALLVLALCSPYLKRGDVGRDLVIVVDRSRSMPTEGDPVALELITLAEDARASGDRVGVVAFGRNAAIERMSAASGKFGGFHKSADGDGSDIGLALDTALDLIPNDRPGSILLISDGEGNGHDALSSARRAAARGVRVDIRPIARDGSLDVSVERLELPDEVSSGEPFQFSAWVRASSRVEAEFELERDGVILSKGRRELEPGLNRLLFRDRTGRAGIAQYHLRVHAEGDRTRENDVGLGALAVVGSKPVLVLNHDGANDALTQALQGGGIPVEVATPEKARLDRVRLASFRAVVLENVAAGRVGLAGLKALDDFVRERGGGLLITGGKASFGLGGYHKSAIDELLPVSLEMRQERRKQGIAMAIVMDRSGSMSVEVRPGVEKMQLADLGAAAAIELLSPLDSVGVIAVDSAAHLIQPLIQVNDPQAMISTVKKIRSEGGGIFVYTGLYAGAAMLDEAEQKNRHLVLFADSNDSEEQEGCEVLADKLLASGTTISVIALGTEADSDADFLKRLAARGGGAIYFTESPEELPRLFAQDTLTFARTTFVEEPTATRASAELFALGNFGATADELGFPTLNGYNLTYARNDASIGGLTLDESKAPVFAFAQRGLGRVAAFTGEIGGTFGMGVISWPRFSAFFITITRWLAGQEEPQDLFASARREGREAVISLEVDAASKTPPDTNQLQARITDPDGHVRELGLERVGDGRFEARFPLERDGISLGTLQVGPERFVSLPPIALPYSPEFEKALDSSAPERLLRRIAQESGGTAIATAAELWRGPRDASEWRLVIRECVFLALLLALAEIATRRLELFARLRWPSVIVNLVARVRAPRVQVASAPATAVDSSQEHEVVSTAGRLPPTTPKAAAQPPAATKPDVSGTSIAIERARKAARRGRGP
ncbi:MAG TPA: VWA domain-containing protein [Planctomycetota bacterium]|nr:VWA domain-containing protein [Planctomycetota bacterium]